MQVRTDLHTNLVRRLYLDACEYFPDNTLSENIDIASTVAQEVLGLDSLNLSAEESSVKVLRQKVSSDDWVRKNAADYHRITAYYFYYNDSYSLHSERVEESMLKAGHGPVPAEYLSESSFKVLVRGVKKDKRLLRKRVGASNKLKIERQKLEMIPPIKITHAHFSFSLTLISTLFLISGFVYTKSFFYWFGVNVGDFYDIQDYLSSSIDVISSTALSAFFGLLCFFYGISRAVNDELREWQFDIQEKRKSYVLPFITVTSGLGLVVSVYVTGRWPSIFVFPIVFSLLIYAYFRNPIWKFVENKATVGIACLVITFFFMHLGFRVKDNVEKVLLGEYEPAYSVEMKGKYEEYSEMSYLTSNSSFVFLVDVEGEKVVVLPRNSVVSYEVSD